MTPAKLTVDWDERRIDAIFARVDSCALPGAAVGIALNGTPVYRKGFGLANMELPLVLTPSTRMRIGSSSKHFTVLAYLLLCEEGEAGLDDPVSRHLPEVHAVARNITMRQLMAHTSGLRDAFDIAWHTGATGRPVSSADLLAMYRDIDDVNTPADVTWNYNNGGYLMLSTAIERLTNRPLEEVLRDRIFTPVGMHDTVLRRFDTDFVPRSATLHFKTPAGHYDRTTLGAAIAGEGGIVSTVDDMLRWLRHMNSPTVGAQETWRAMTTPRILANGTSTNYGLGLRRSDYRGVELIWHAGGVLAGNSQMIKVPAVGLDIVIMVNRSDVSAMELAERIMDACLTGLAPIAASPAPIVTGLFRSRVTGRVVQLLARDGKQIAVIAGADMPMIADAQGVLHPAPPRAYIKQSITVKNDQAIVFDDFGNRDELVAVTPDPAASIATAAGRYVHAATGGVLTLPATGPAEIAGKFGTTRYTLDPLASGIWRARAMDGTGHGGILAVDGQGTCRLSTGRTPNLVFQRQGG